MHFWKSYICSNKLDVQETNFSFTQFNRIRNHLFGRWIEIASGRKAWQEEEETGKDSSIVLIRQEQSCTSELFKDIQDAVSLILLYRTM